jgi:NADH dehydrogenase/NADH:ubiquinone oxidoreductase subunit G
MSENAATVAPEELAPSAEELAATEVQEDLAPQEDAATAGPAELAPAEPQEPDKHQQEINRNVRKRYEAEREAKELRERIAALEAQNKLTAADLGPKPSMEDPDVDFDADKLATKLDTYYGRKAQIDAAATIEKQTQQVATEKANESIRRQEAEYTVKANAFAKDHPDYDAAFNNYAATSQNQAVGHAILAAVNSPDIINFLGNNLDKVEELNGMTPAAAAVEIGKIDGRIEATKTKKPTSAPDPIAEEISGGGAGDDDDFAKKYPNAEFV